MMGTLAVVAKVLPERHGVMVRMPGMSLTYDTGEDDGAFVRVLARRAHPAGGAEICLPQVGEMGVVLELDDGHQVWIGGVHLQDSNWVDPTVDLEMSRHTSGFRRQVRGDGDMQFDHPSGLRLTIAKQQGALSELQRKGEAYIPPKDDCDIELEHPSGLTFHIDKGGALSISFPAGGSISVDKDGNFNASGFAKMELQEASARFVMEAALDWMKTHVHTSAASGSPTSAPTTQPSAASLSPNAFKGPHA